MKWFETLFRKTRRSGEGASCSLLSMLAPSLLGMAVCLLSLCSLSWAWFNMSVNTGVSTIQSAMVEVAVAYKEPATANTTEAVELPWTGFKTLAAFSSENPPSDNQYSCPLIDNKLYFIARGTAASAYLKIGATYYGPLDLTAQTDDGAYKVYSIDLSNSSSNPAESPVTVSLFWGTPAGLTTGNTATTPSENYTARWPSDTSTAASAMLFWENWDEEEEEEGEENAPVEPITGEQPTEEPNPSEGEGSQTSEGDKNSEDPKQEQDTEQGTEQGGTTGTGTSDSSSGETSGTTGDDASGSGSGTPAAGADPQQPSTPSTGNDTPGSGETTE